MGLFDTVGTDQARSWESHLGCPDWVKLLSDAPQFLSATIHVTRVAKLEDTAEGPTFEVYQTQPLLLGLTTKLKALCTLLLASSTSSSLINPAAQGDIIRVQTWADLSTHTSSTWSVQDLAGGRCNVTERYRFETPWITHAIVAAQVDQTHNESFSHYQEWIEDHIVSSARASQS